MLAIESESVLVILSLSELFANSNNYLHYSIEPLPAFNNPKPILAPSP